MDLSHLSSRRYICSFISHELHRIRRPHCRLDICNLAHTQWFAKMTRPLASARTATKSDRDEVRSKRLVIAPTTSLQTEPFSTNRSLAAKRLTPRSVNGDQCLLTRRTKVAREREAKTVIFHGCLVSWVFGSFGTSAHKHRSGVECRCEIELRLRTRSRRRTYSTMGCRCWQRPNRRHNASDLMVELANLESFDWMVSSAASQSDRS